MKYKRNLKKIIVFLLLITLLLNNFNIRIALAAPKCNMENGEIIIEITSKAATASIHYRTLGFNVTTQYQNKKITAKGLEGPDAPIGPYGTFYLSEGEKISGDPIDGETTTTFRFSDQKVKKCLLNILDLNRITTSTKLYLNAIFQVYDVSEDGKEYIHPGEITTWQEIVMDQDWASISPFKDYFNIELVFKPGSQPNSLYYDLEGAEYYKGELGDLNIGEKVTWIGKVTKDTSIDKKPCTLTGFYVKNKLSKEIIESWNVGDTVQGGTTTFTLTADYIINKASTVEKYGGLDVHMVYKVDDTQTLNPNSLYYVYNGVSKSIVDLDDKKTGQSVTWSTQVKNNSPSDYFGKGKTYNLQGYYIKAKDSSVSLKGKTSLYKKSDGATDSQIINGSAIEVKGGLNVYIVYDNGKVTPTPTPKPSTTPNPSTTPKPSTTPAPEPTIPPLEIPQGGNEVQPVAAPTSTGIIKADNRGSEKFVVEQGIPTTESLYTQVETTPYLIGYNFEKEVVVKEYPVEVSKTYNLSWKNMKDPKKTVKDKVTVTQTVTIKRACAYWVINNMSYYVIDNAQVYNKALPDGKCILYPDSKYYNPPKLNTVSNRSESYHIIDPEETKGITLPEESISSGDSNKPVVDPGNFLDEADSLVGEIKVRNDYVSFDGTVVMDNDYYDKETPGLKNLSVLKPVTSMTGINVLYKSDQIIKATLANDTYYSTGNMSYKAHSNAVNCQPTYGNMIINLNQVRVHTPVICDPSIKADNKKWVQLVNPEESYVPLVLDPDPSLSNFTVQISNTGHHSGRVGYFIRDMAWSLRKPKEVSYMDTLNNFYRNEVQFPFDVYLNQSGDDLYIPKNTWITIGFNTPSFYLPMWVEEGEYTVKFRTIAANATTNEKINLRTEKYANTDPNNYVATNNIKVQVSGRIYGLTITDISDKREWDEVFHDNGLSALKSDGNYVSGVDKPKFNSLYAYDYTVGTRNQYGQDTGRLSRFTFPLVNGSHPRWSNIGIMKKGYSVTFELKTTGNHYGINDSVLIRPKFYYVDARGKNRQEVDIYYSQYFNGKSNNLVKIGSSRDKINIFTFRNDDLVPKSEGKTMADIFGVPYDDYKTEKLDLFTYAKMRIFSPLMAYTNKDYLIDIEKSSQYSKIQKEGINPVDIMKRKQTWYGEYWLPADIYAVKKGYDVMDYASKKGVTYHEKFWLTGGYIIINFDIVTLDSKGKEHLSYINTENALKGYCSMWNMEGAAAYKTSYQGKAKGSFEISFEPGDFLIYSTDISLRDDYTTYIN